VISKVLVKDLLLDLQMATNGYVVEKTEGLTVDQDGNVWLINDNDAADNNSGETLFLNLGKASVSRDGNGGCEFCLESNCVQCPK
jgi:alkaline phosphatase